MRDLINLTLQLFEDNDATVDELEAMKSVLSAKIKELPIDEQTAKALREIEDLLTHVSRGGKMGIVGHELQSINDPTVSAAQKMLARYILSIDMEPKQRKQLFDLWREDKLVNRKKLLQVGKKTLSDVIAHYDDNPGIKELVDDLMSVQALGQGKGEFALSVLSKSIGKPDKGDLIVDGRKVEVKTTDGGAGRFTDQEVRPGAGFEQAARTLNAYTDKVLVQLGAKPLPKSGLSLGLACQIGPKLQDNKEFVKLCKNVVNIIFDNSDNSAVNKIGEAISTGNQGVAMQEYAKLSFNYYMDKKDDEGVLYISLVSNPTSLIWFTEADELAASGLRLHAGTVYITSIADIRLPYPQMEITETSRGSITLDQPDTVSAPTVTQQKASAIDQQIQNIAGRTTAPRPTRDEAPRQRR
jgi:hypothetical protein